MHEPPLGEVFCANVFGHYMLAHGLVPLLKASAGSGGPLRGDGDDNNNNNHNSNHNHNHCGRIIWISSIEADAAADFSAADIQALRSPIAYECSKRLTDILALTFALPSTRPWTQRFLGRGEGAEGAEGGDGTHPGAQKHDCPVKMYVAHPGVCATSIVPLHALLALAMVVALYLARWLGSPWHTISAYSGASAPVWLALSPQALLDGANNNHNSHDFSPSRHLDPDSDQDPDQDPDQDRGRTKGLGEEPSRSASRSETQNDSQNRGQSREQSQAQSRGQKKRSESQSYNNQSQGQTNSASAGASATATATASKWGSATDMWGRDRVMRTDVAGWGYSGVVVVGGTSKDVSKRRRGRRRGAADLTDDARQAFELLGRACWRQMEELRAEWAAALLASTTSTSTSTSTATTTTTTTTATPTITHEEEKKTNMNEGEHKFS